VSRRAGFVQEFVVGEGEAFREDVCWCEVCGAGLSAVAVRVRDRWAFSRIEYGDESRRKGRVGSMVDDFSVVKAVRGAGVEYRDWFGGCLM
jgi:hypothetical protein